MREVMMRVSGRGGRWRLGVSAAALATVSLLGAAPCAVAAAASPRLDWTQQHPATSPPARTGAAMAYDRANGTVVLFGGAGRTGFVGDTWTWNGTTWTQQHPATHPSRRMNMAMAYDAGTGTVVLFGGAGVSGTAGCDPICNDTWTWNGTTWTQQHPTTSPSPRQVGPGTGAMAYDAAKGNVVLFGGYSESNQPLGDTWTWNGTTWTQRQPATSPPARIASAMAYDAATGTVVLFGGADFVNNIEHYVGGTWTWDGTTWTKQHPVTSPSARAAMVMAYDPATGAVVLFGGGNSNGQLGNTWTWDGTTWTIQHPATSPSAREDASMAYDPATRTEVLFSGFDGQLSNPRDTWTWG
jgi:hypothetical protein